MKKSALFLLVGVVCLLLSVGCSANLADEDKNDAKVVNVAIQPVQEVLIPGRAILIDAHVTENAADLTDADAVTFEIWKKDSDKHETIAASHWQDGVYRIKTLFHDGGVYYAKVHVTAKDVTVISPEKELTVADSEWSQ